MSENSLDVFICPKCNGTNISIDLNKNMTCLNSHCNYKGKINFISGDKFTEPFIKIIEQEKENLKPWIYWQEREKKEKERNYPPHL